MPQQLSEQPGVVFLFFLRQGEESKNQEIVPAKGALVFAGSVATRSSRLSEHFRNNTVLDLCGWQNLGQHVTPARITECYFMLV